MPFGVPLKVYMKAIVVTFASGLCGSQVVHKYYQPLKNFDELVTEEMKKIEISDMEEQLKWLKSPPDLNTYKKSM